MKEKVQQLQDELDNVASTMRGYVAEYSAVYNEEVKKYGENSKEALAVKTALDAINNITEELGIEIHLKNYYFTFGSSKQYPYKRDQYIVVKAQNKQEAARKYRRKYPNPNAMEILNCADYYCQKEWDERIKQYYNESSPAEIIE